MITAGTYQHENNKQTTNKEGQGWNANNGDHEGKILQEM